MATPVCSFLVAVMLLALFDGIRYAWSKGFKPESDMRYLQTFFCESTSPAPSRLCTGPCTGQQIVGDLDAEPRCDVQCTFARVPHFFCKRPTHYFWESTLFVVYMCAPGVVS